MCYVGTLLNSNYSTSCHIKLGRLIGAFINNNLRIAKCHMDVSIKIEIGSPLFKNNYYSTSCHIKIGGLIIEKKIRAFMNNNCS